MAMSAFWRTSSHLEEASGLPPRESFRGPLLRTSCSVDVAMGSAVEVEGLGEGLSWRQALRLVW